jgi:hypothetical protein
MENNKRQKTLLIITIAAAGLLILDYVVIEPLIKSWKARSEHIAEMRAKIDDGLLWQKRASSLEYRWERMQSNTFPASTSQSENEMLKCFDRWSQTSGISISSLKPQWKDTDEGYNALVCRADGAGNIQTIARFLYELEKDPLPLKVEAVEISSREDDGQQLSLGIQVSGLLITNK